MTTSTQEYYVAVDYWVDGYTIDELVINTTPEPVTVQTTIPMYLYWQYNDDSDLKAFVSSYNSTTQMYVNTFNQLNLPVYADNPLVTGALLDWVGQGIYGFPRPVLTTGSTVSTGPYNTKPYNTVGDPYNELVNFSNVSQIQTTDDLYCRILTWNLYRGDGKIFNIPWLKRRVLRFLEGINGTSPTIDQTYLVSVTLAGTAFTIDLTSYQTTYPASTMPAALQAAIQSGCLYLPFMYSYTVTY